jgi:hypothetical protein
LLNENKELKNRIKSKEKIITNKNNLINNKNNLIRKYKSRKVVKYSDKLKKIIK